MKYIRHFLYLGSVSGARNAALMSEYRVGAVLNCAHEIEPMSASILVDANMHYCKLSLRDEPEFDIYDDLHQGADFIKEWRQVNVPVFVHCAMGVSRRYVIWS